MDEKIKMSVSTNKLFRSTSPDGQTIWVTDYGSHTDMCSPSSTAYWDDVYFRKTGIRL